ncbi:MAG: acetate--CoA ligase family protein [Patescibacteria group bacterium]
MKNLDAIFKPKSVAIVGASTKEHSVGNEIVKNLTAGFSGHIFPVNPKATELYGLPCFPTLTAIGQKIDLMIVVVPAAIVPAIMEEGGSLGIKGAIIISAGFKESGHSELEDEVKKICEKYDIALIGPNCLGIINPALQLNASFAAVMPPVGSVAFISQSGALCTAILDCAKEMGIGFSKFMSVGNKAVISEVAILEYLAEDADTKVIAMYVEQLSDPEPLMAIIRKITTGANPKPIIALKSGRTGAGAGASASHTGALAGNDAAYEALFRQSGVIRADSVNELFNYIKIFSANPIKSAKNLAIITNAGGPGVLAIDAVVEDGLVPAVLSPETTAKLVAALPASANLHNPIDIIGDAMADRYRAALDAVLSDQNVDSVLLILTPQAMTEIEETANALVAAKNKFGKPVAAAFMGEELVLPGITILKNSGVAAFSYPEEAVKALDILNNFFEHASLPIGVIPEIKDVNREAVAKIFAEARQAGLLSFPEARALAVLEAYGLPVLKGRVAKTREEAEAIAKEFGVKTVMKIVSQDILHKSDAGGISLNILPEEAGDKFEILMARVTKNRPEAKLEGVLLEEMIIDSGVELILGGIKDPSFGNMIMVGLGGIFVEVLKDVAFGLNPLSREDVLVMLGSLKSKKMLAGVRGAKPAGLEAVVEAVLHLAKLLEDFPEIKELDINPLLALEVGKGVKVLDARIVIE